MAEYETPIYGVQNDLVDARKEKLDVLSNLENKKVISKDGSDFITVCLDPFHDKATKLKGFPSLNSEMTLPQVITQGFTITKPVDLASGGKWDVNIALMPIVSPVILCNGGILSTRDGSLTLYNDTLADDPYDAGLALTDYAFELNSCSYHKVATGLQTFAPNYTTVDYMSKAYGGISLSDFASTAVDTGRVRVIGYAMEVVNSTAVLETSGSVTYYRQPSAVHNTFLYKHLDTQVEDVELDFCLPTLAIRAPPTNIATAKAFSNSATVHAKEGGYVVATLQDTENPFEAGFFSEHMLSRYDDGKPSNQAETNNVVYHSNYSKTLPSLGSFKTHSVFQRTIPFSESGMYFTGLSEGTVLTVTVRAILEICPGPLDPLQTFAHLGEAYDINALALYSQVARELPSGCRVGDNPAGEWWALISSVLKSVAGPLLDTIGSMNIPGLSTFAKIGSPLLSHALATHKKKKQKMKKKTMVVQPRREEKVVFEEKPVMHPKQSNTKKSSISTAPSFKKVAKRKG